MWCLLAHACSSIPLHSGFLRSVPASPRLLFCTECSRAVIRVLLASPRVLFCAECSRAYSAWCLLAYACSSVPCAVELFAAWCLLTHTCSSVPSVVEPFSAWCLLAHSCFSVPNVAELFFPRGAGQRTRALFYLVLSGWSSRGVCLPMRAFLCRVQSDFLCVMPASPGMLFCTNQSSCSTRCVGQPTRALLYRV